MEQTNKPTFGQIAAAGAGAAVSFGLARYFRMEGGPVSEGIATFLATLGWLAGIGAVILIFLWAARSDKS